MELLAVRAPVGQALMLRDDGRRCGDFYLLQNIGWTLGKAKQTAAVGAAIRPSTPQTVDGLGRKRRSQMLLMSWLRPPPAFLCRPYATAWAA